MTEPFLSIVVPVLNEESCIASFVTRMREEVTGRVPSWEIVVADDGSTDGTRAIVERCALEDARIRLSPGEHRGKGAAVRRGLLVARGRWRFMADADLAMPPENIWRFLSQTSDGTTPAILAGSREAPGARRIGEPYYRHAVGRVFNWIVRTVVVSGIQDTQCGYKLFSREAAERIAPRLTIDGFAFDVEVLFLARHLGLGIREVGIVWHARGNSRVAVWKGGAAFLDLLRIRWRWRALAGR